MPSAETRRSFITGASSGIGRSLAIALAARGESLFLSGRHPQRLQEVAEQCRQRLGDCGTVESQVAELSDLQQCRKLAEAALRGGGQGGAGGGAPGGTLTRFVHCAGVGYFGSAESQSGEVLLDLLRTNFVAAAEITRQLLGHFKSRQQGQLVYVLSVAAKRPFANVCGYTASKFALRGYAEALRQDLRGSGIAITCALPVATRTRFWERAGYVNWEQTHANTAVHEADPVAAKLAAALDAQPREWFPDLRSRLLDFGQRMVPRAVEWLNARGTPAVAPQFEQHREIST